MSRASDDEPDPAAGVPRPPTPPPAASAPAAPGSAEAAHALPRPRPRARTALVVAVLVAATSVVVGVGVILVVGGGDTAGRDGLAVSDAWTGPNPSLMAVYLTMDNGGEEDWLIDATTDIATSVLVMGGESDVTHGSASGAGPVRIAVPSGITELEPGGGHLMVQGLSRSLQPGDRFTLRLTFERGGTIEVPVDVVSWDEVAERAG